MEQTKEMTFEVITELPVVVFNVEELKAQALALVERYDGLVFTEEEIPAVRRDMAMLNGLAEKLERARIDTAKQMMAPIKQFEVQIKEVSAILLKTRETLGAKVQEYVQQQREIRREAVLQAIEDVRTKYMTFCSILDVPVRETWLAKSTSMLSVKSDINDIFAAHTKAGEDAAALIVAKNERVQAIEAKAAGLEAQYGFVLPRMGFAQFLDLSTPLAEAYGTMDYAYQAENDRRAEAARIAAEKAERERVERERQEAVKAERERVAAEHEHQVRVVRMERERAAAEEQARLDAEAARNRITASVDAAAVKVLGDASIAAEQAMAPRKDGPVFATENPCPDCDSCTGSPDCSDVHGVRVDAMEALKALAQEIKAAPHLVAVKNSKAFSDAVAVIKAGG